MSHPLRSWLLPESQRRTVEELTEDLALSWGDRKAKLSAFWTMLTLSTLVAGAGVMADSTATVIGAMIIAPLSTPIMATALSLVERRRIPSLRFVVLGALLVIAVGLVFALIAPSTYDLDNNSQVTGRVQPGLFDLIGASATGLAGAIALSRRDIAAVLPGVAISISLVPPLVVVGLCLGQGEQLLAAGAMLLFLSNFVALVLAGTFVFAALGYADAADADADPARRSPTIRAKVVLGTLAVAVAVPLLISTGVSVWANQLDHRATVEADAWLEPLPGTAVTEVTVSFPEVVVEVRTPGEIPPVDDLRERLAEVVPGWRLVVETRLGERLDVGDVPSP